MKKTRRPDAHYREKNAENALKRVAGSDKPTIPQTKILVPSRGYGSQPPALGSPQLCGIALSLNIPDPLSKQVPPPTLKAPPTYLSV